MRRLFLQANDILAGSDSCVNPLRAASPRYVGQLAPDAISRKLSTKQIDRYRDMAFESDLSRGASSTRV